VTQGVLLAGPRGQPRRGKGKERHWEALEKIQQRCHPLQLYQNNGTSQKQDAPHQMKIT